MRPSLVISCCLSAVWRVGGAGAFDTASDICLAASNRFDFNPAFVDPYVGFRVASIPEPATGLLLVLATVGLLMRRRAAS